MNGQLDLFSYMEPLEEPPRLISAGQEIFVVVKADIEKMRASGESWMYDGNRGYCLKRKNGSYHVTSNRDLNINAFMDYVSAKRKSDKYLKSHPNVMLSRDVNPVKTVAYSYVRNCDKKEMTAFYCDIGNGLYYVKEFMTFAHIRKGESFKKGFMEQQEFKFCDPCEIKNYKPEFKTMYRCTEQSDWEYAEGGYTYAIG